MKTCDFRLVLRGVEELTVEASDALYEAGCDDGSAGSSGSVSHIDFHRDAVSFEEAVISAIENVRAAGFDVTSVESYETGERYLTPAISRKLREGSSALPQT